MHNMLDLAGVRQRNPDVENLKIHRWLSIKLYEFTRNCYSQECAILGYSVYIFGSSLLRFYTFCLQSSTIICPRTISAFHFIAHHYAASHVAYRSTVVVCNAFRISLGLLRLGQTESESLAQHHGSTRQRGPRLVQLP